LLEVSVFTKYIPKWADFEKAGAISIYTNIGIFVYISADDLQTKNTLNGAFFVLGLLQRHNLPVMLFRP